MKYCVLDLETTGLDWNKNQILQLSAVVEDSERPDIPLQDLPTFNEYIGWENFSISSSAVLFHINTGFWSRYEVAEKVLPKAAIRSFINFLRDHFGEDKAVLSGKNVGTFDLRFLEVIFKDLGYFMDGLFHHRILDFVPNFTLPNDKEPPNLKTCLRRAGIEKEVAHDGLEDCYDVVRLGRASFAKNRVLNDQGIIR